MDMSQVATLMDPTVVKALLALQGAGVALCLCAMAMLLSMQSSRWRGRVLGHEVVVAIYAFNEQVFVDEVRVQTSRRASRGRVEHGVVLPGGQTVSVVLVKDCGLAVDCRVSTGDVMSMDGREGPVVAPGRADPDLAAARMLVLGVKRRDSRVGATARELLTAWERVRGGGAGRDVERAEARRSGAVPAAVETSEVAALQDELIGALRDLHQAGTPTAPMPLPDVVGRAEDVLQRARAMQVERQALGMHAT